MEQYSQIKAKHAGDILLFRLGDFYEMFYEDAKTAAKVLGIVLTSRTKGDARKNRAGDVALFRPEQSSRQLRGEKCSRTVSEDRNLRQAQGEVNSTASC